MANISMSLVGYNPDDDKDDILLEEVKDDPSPKERLFDFLSKAGKEDYIDNIYPMFNVPFVLKETLLPLITTSLQEEWKSFNKVIGQEILQRDSLEFVHYVSLGVTASEISSIKKRWYIFPDQIHSDQLSGTQQGLYDDGVKCSLPLLFISPR